MSPYVSANVYSTICQTRDAFVGYQPSLGAYGLVIIPWSSTGTRGFCLDSTGNTAVNGMLTVNSDTSVNGNYYNASTIKTKWWFSITITQFRKLLQHLFAKIRSVL